MKAPVSKAIFHHYCKTSCLQLSERVSVGFLWETQWRLKQTPNPKLGLVSARLCRDTVLSAGGMRIWPLRCPGCGLARLSLASSKHVALGGRCFISSITAKSSAAMGFPCLGASSELPFSSLPAAPAPCRRLPSLTGNSGACLRWSPSNPPGNQRAATTRTSEGQKSGERWPRVTTNVMFVQQVSLSQWSSQSW